MARRLRLATTHLQTLTINDMTGRVARHLLVCVQSHGTALPNGEFLIPFRLTQQELARSIGTSRTTVQQALAAFEQSGWIRTGRCPLTDQCFRITVRDPAALKARCFQAQSL